MKDREKDREKDRKTDLSYIMVEDKKQIWHIYLDGKKTKGHYIGDIHDKWIDLYCKEIPAAELALII